MLYGFHINDLKYSNNIPDQFFHYLLFTRDHITFGIANLQL